MSTPVDARFTRRLQAGTGADPAPIDVPSSRALRRSTSLASPRETSPLTNGSKERHTPLNRISPAYVIRVPEPSASRSAVETPIEPDTWGG